jgi:hypothetical protein
MKPYWETIDEIIYQCDIILEVLDARMPELSRNNEIEERVKKSGKQLIFVVNKADLISSEQRERILKNLKEEHECFIVSAKEKIGTKRLRDYIHRLVSLIYARYYPTKTLLKDSRKKMHADKHAKKLKLGVVGYPNTGKSSVINSLVMKKKAMVSKRAGTTHGVHWIYGGELLLIMDSPGVIPLQQNDEVRYALLGARDVSKIKDLSLAAYNIIKLFRGMKRKLEDLYRITLESDNPDEWLEEIGRKKGFIAKGGEIDENRASIMIIRDWQQGKLRL